MKKQNKYPNALLEFRLRRNLSQKRVVSLLDLKDPAMVSRYEKGHGLPSLRMALEFEILYRVPVAFLFPKIYDALRSSVRSRESRLPSSYRQQTLF